MSREDNDWEENRWEDERWKASQREHNRTVKGIKYIFCGIGLVAIVFLAVIIWNAIDLERYNYERYTVEVLVVKREARNTDERDLYLLHCEKKDGKQEIYEINKAAIGERFEEYDVFREIKVGRYYRLELAETREFDSVYPCICGAAQMIDGFTEEESQEEEK